MLDNTYYHYNDCIIAVSKTKIYSQVGNSRVFVSTFSIWRIHFLSFLRSKKRVVLVAVSVIPLMIVEIVSIVMEVNVVSPYQFNHSLVKLTWFLLIKVTVRMISLVSAILTQRMTEEQCNVEKLVKLGLIATSSSVVPVPTTFAVMRLL